MNLFSFFSTMIVVIERKSCVKDMPLFICDVFMERNMASSLMKFICAYKEIYSSGHREAAKKSFQSTDRGQYPSK